MPFAILLPLGEGVEGHQRTALVYEPAEGIEASQDPHPP